MAWGALRRTGRSPIERDAPARSLRGIAVKAILVNLLNPKLSIFFLAFLPQFVGPSEAHPLARMLALSGCSWP